MKLYTEEQVKRAIELSRDTHQEGGAYMERDEYDYSMEEVINLLTSIELPSDNEIENSNPFAWKNNPCRKRDLFVWKDGVEWMIDKIQGGK